MGKLKYINYKHNRYLYTDDNWKTIHITSDHNAPSGYKNDTNINHRLEAHLKFHYGLRPGSFLIKELKTITKIREEVTQIPANKKQGYGDEFEIFCMNALHNVSYKKAVEKYIVIGENDGGVDAVFYDDTKKECTVYQIKLSGSLTDSNLPRMKTSIDLYIQGTLDSQPNSSHLKEFLDKNLPNIADYKLKFKTISENGTLGNNIPSTRVFDRFIDNKTLLSPENHTLRIRLNSSVDDKKTYASLPGNKIVFVFVNAKKFIEDLVSCYGDNMEEAFVNNVRGYVGEDDEMKKTIETEPEKFCSFNNGISITGKVKFEEASYFVTVENTCVVNGQQTIYNLYNYAKETGKSIEKITLPVFIKQFTNSSEQSKIARYNNSQKSVSQLDLLSIDAKIRKLQKQLINGLDDDENTIYYLNVVSTGEKGIVKNATTVFGKNNIVKLSDFVKVFSVIHNPERMGLWKNSLNSQIKETYNGTFADCSIEEARKICSCIIRSKSIIAEDRSEFAIADLQIQYLLYLGIDENTVKSIILKTTAKYLGSVQKKADIYKSKNCYSHLMGSVPKKYRP